MNIFVGLTDRAWFEFLRHRADGRDVNFWRPSGQPFRALAPGEPYLFQLHAPVRQIVGGGFFVGFFQWPVDVTWSHFELDNGSETLAAMRAQMARYNRRVGRDPHHAVGSVLLAEAFFFDEDEWFAAPNFPTTGVQVGKGYSTQDPAGRWLWNEVAVRLATRRTDDRPAQGALVEGARFGAPLLVAPRLGQGAFRALITDAYGRRCAVTGERTLPALEAAHIQPYAAGGPHAVDNGLLLRSDLHRLFDLGYLMVHPDTRELAVSQRIRREFENGRDYYALAGRALAPPRPGFPAPRREFLAWHADAVFVG
ncbi:MAG: HNH endonuclease [Thermaerobacter sp.]|nr:HNH endonuclease [Thermaerobacter sp.]